MKRSKIKLALTYAEFVATRIFGTGVDLLVLWICSTFLFTSYWGEFVLSPIISFEFAVMSNFLWSYFWIWSSRIPHKTWKNFWKSFFIFNISSGVGFLANLFFLLLTEKVFGWSVIPCKITALLISGILNFFLADSMVFRKSKKSPMETEIEIEIEEEEVNEAIDTQVVECEKKGDEENNEGALKE